MKNTPYKILERIETYYKKKIVFAHALLPFGAIREAHAHCTHLQSTHADPQPKICKRVQFSPPLKDVTKYIFIVILLTFSLNVFSTDYYITTSDLNLRSGAGKNYKTLGTISKGDTVKLIDNTGKYWMKIQYHDKIGYSSKQFLEEIQIHEVEQKEEILEESESGSFPILIGFILLFVVIPIILTKSGKKHRNISLSKFASFFFGALGFQKFYLGQTNKGIFSILFCWTFIPSLIGLIDFIKLTLMSKDNFNIKYNGRIIPIKKSSRKTSAPPKPVTKNIQKNRPADQDVIDIDTEKLISPIEQSNSFKDNSLEPPIWVHSKVLAYKELNYATKPQRKFYFHFRKKVLNNEFVDIQGNSNYAFILYFDFLKEYRNHGDIKKLEEQYELLGQICPKTKSYSLKSLQDELLKLSDSNSLKKLKDLEEANSQFEYDLSPNSIKKNKREHKPTDQAIIDINTEKFDLTIEQSVNAKETRSEPPFWEHTYIYSYDEIIHATKGQKKYYYYFKYKVLNNEFVDIQGHTNYAFILYFDLLNEYENHRDIKLLEEQFKLLGQICPKTKSYSLHSLQDELRKRSDSNSLKKLKDLEEPSYQLEYGYSDSNPDLIIKLGNQYKDKLGLDKQEIRWLNKFYNPSNVFTSIEGCCLAVINIYLAVLHKLNFQLSDIGSSIDKELEKIFDKVCEIENLTFSDYYKGEKPYWAVGRFQESFFITFYKTIENLIREKYGHKRKLNFENYHSYTKSTQYIDEIIGNQIQDIITEKVQEVSEPDLETQIALNTQNVNRWRIELDELIVAFKKEDISSFIDGVIQLEETNQKNPNIENIFYQASKLISKYDKNQSLKYYAKYIYYDLKSKKFDNKELPKIVQKSLFKTEEQIKDFKEIIGYLIATRDIQTALEKISKIYITKRKRIQLDRSEIQEVEQKHEGTVELLNEYLVDDKENPVSEIDDKSEEDIEIAIIPSKKNNSVFISEISIEQVQEELVKMIINNSFKIHQDEVDKFATVNGLFKHQLIESINESCENHLDGEALIEEEDENYVIEESYYKEIAI